MIDGVSDHPVEGELIDPMSSRLTRPGFGSKGRCGDQHAQGRPNASVCCPTGQTSGSALNGDFGEGSWQSPPGYRTPSTPIFPAPFSCSRSASPVGSSGSRSSDTSQPVRRWSFGLRRADSITTPSLPDRLRTTPT